MILTYHVVSEDSPYLYSIHPRDMEEHVRFMSGMQAESRQNGMPCVTFDDGHVSQYYDGLPLLEQFHLRGIFFITAEWTDSKPGYMSWVQLRDIVRRGHEVQSHGWSHKFLTQCSPSELRQELRRSKQVLEDGLGTQVDALAIPNGAWNGRVLSECAEAGYRRVYTSEPFLRQVKRGNLELFGRVSVQRTTTSRTLAQFARAERTVFSSVRVRHRAKRAVRAALGQRLYHRLWCWIARADSRDDVSPAHQDTLGKALKSRGATF
jgi:peptidoglycan/xylan/chitin deacetylase (PgdA/CDA1 family)